MGKRNIFLVGFMGSGKSTVGPMLAARLKMPFIDLDQVIEKTSGKKIREIFRDQGEQAFRELERDCLLRCSQGEPSVIALGGGAFQDAANRALTKESGTTIWLQVSLEAVFDRALGDEARPLAQDRQNLERLYRRRQRMYREASVHIDTDGLSPQEVCTQILTRLDSRNL